MRKDEEREDKADVVRKRKSPKKAIARTPTKNEKRD
jgi:hypothetical protein